MVTNYLTNPSAIRQDKDAVTGQRLFALIAIVLVYGFPVFGSSGIESIPSRIVPIDPPFTEITPGPPGLVNGLGTGGGPN